MKVLWVTNVPSPYRVKFFRELDKRCDLTVVFECAFSKERDDSWRNMDLSGLNTVQLKGYQYKTDMAFCPGIVRYLNRSYDIIVITDYASVTGMLAIQYLKIRKIPFILEGDGAYMGGGKGPKEYLKWCLIRAACFAFSTSEVHSVFYRFYGVEESRIFQYPFTSLKQEEILTVPVSSEEKKTLRKKLKISYTRMFLSVGQQIHRKGFDILLEAMKEFGEETGCYIIGGTIKKEFADYLEANFIRNVHFIDFMNYEDLKVYYQAADLFVLPTREDIWGLVVNEALANGLPVITTTACIAGQELLDETRGILVAPNDPKALAVQMRRLISDDAWREEAAASALKKMDTYSIENMARVHVHYFDQIVKG